MQLTRKGGFYYFFFLCTLFVCHLIKGGLYSKKYTGRYCDIICFDGINKN